MSLMEFSPRTDDDDDELIPSPRQRRRASLTGEPSDLELLAQWQEDSLIPLKEDLAEWLAKTLGKSQIRTHMLKYQLGVLLIAQMDMFTVDHGILSVIPPKAFQLFLSLIKTWFFHQLHNCWQLVLYLFWCLPIIFHH